MFKKLSFLLALSILLTTAASAAIDTAWTRKFNDASDSLDSPTDIALDQSGNVYVAGFAYNGDNGFDLIVLKYNPSGDLDMEFAYNTLENYHEKSMCLTVDKSGSVYVAGMLNSPDYKADFLIVKFDSTGSVQWANQYAGTADDEDLPYVIKVDKNGNVFVAGTVVNETGKDFCVIKYNPSGGQEWISFYDGPYSGTDDLYGMAIDDKSNVYVCGESRGLESYEDYATVKFDAKGKQAWVARYSSRPKGGTDKAKALALDKQGNVVVTGEADYSFTTIKYNPNNGKEIWSSKYSTFIDDAYLLGVNDEGDVYVAGSTHGADMYDDWQIVKYDAKGKELWHYLYGLDKSDELPKAMTLDKQGNLYLAGGVFKSKNDVNMVTMKFDPQTGTPSGFAEYFGYYFDEPKAIAVDPDGNIYVTGVSEGAWTDRDILTIKYIQK
jgi:uncharacterized delta-60 repeat protein